MFSRRVDKAPGAAKRTEVSLGFDVSWRAIQAGLEPIEVFIQ
jgi:hypothetical protein